MSWEQDPWMNPETRMARKSQQRDWRSGRKRVLTIIGCTIGLYAAYLLLGGEFGLWRLHALQKREVLLADQITVAQGRVDALKLDLTNINETREREARLGFGFAKPNEMIYEIVEPDSASGTEMGAEPAEPGGSFQDEGAVPQAPKADQRAVVKPGTGKAPAKAPAKVAGKAPASKPAKKPAGKAVKHPAKKGR